MPGSGYGRIIGAGKTKDFWGVDQDVAAFAQFIRRYITNFNRWNSPRFLFGESYGTTRSSALAKYLQDAGVGLNGVVLLSSFLNSNIDYNDGAPVGGGDWGYVLYLPTEAAAAWYHRALPGAPALNAVLPEVERFALTEYLDALAQGAQLDPSRFNDVVAKLHRYTGLSEEYIRSSNLRIPVRSLRKRAAARQRGLTVGPTRRAFPDLRPRPARDLARLGRDRRRDRLGLRFDGQLLFAAGVEIQHAAALPGGDLRSDLRGRRERGISSTVTTRSRSTSRPTSRKR